MRSQTITRRTPEDFGWTADDLRSAYAADGSGPYRYAPDGAGPFSYDPDGSGPWSVGLEARDPSATPVPFSPRSRGSWSRGRRIARSVVGGAVALVLVAGSVGLVVDRHLPSTDRPTAAVLHSSAQNGD
jgi:hypothetical protein